MFDFIVSGLIDIFGYGVLLALLFIASFILMILSRGAGITATIGTFFLTVYLFANEKIGGTYLLTYDWYLTAVILLGLFIGFLFYMVFVR